MKEVLGWTVLEAVPVAFPELGLQAQVEKDSLEFAVAN